MVWSHILLISRISYPDFCKLAEQPPQRPSVSRGSYRQAPHGYRPLQRSPKIQPAREGARWLVVTGAPRGQVPFANSRSSTCPRSTRGIACELFALLTNCYLCWRKQKTCKLLPPPHDYPINYSTGEKTCKHSLTHPVEGNKECDTNSCWRNKVKPNLPSPLLHQRLGHIARKTTE